MRRTYVLDRGFQFKYSLLLAAIGAAVSLLFGGMMYLAHVEAFRQVPPGTELAEELARAKATMVWLTAATALLMAFALGLFGVLITHRVSGPVHVMNHYLTLLAGGRYPKMRPLRKHDELKEFFEGLQKTIESLRLRESDEARTLEETLASLSMANVPPATVDRLKTLLDKKVAATHVS